MINISIIFVSFSLPDRTVIRSGRSKINGKQEMKMRDAGNCHHIPAVYQLNIEREIKEGKRKEYVRSKMRSLVSTTAWSISLTLRVSAHKIHNPSPSFSNSFHSKPYSSSPSLSMAASAARVHRCPNLFGFCVRASSSLLSRFSYFFLVFLFLFCSGFTQTASAVGVTADAEVFQLIKAHQVVYFPHFWP